MAPRRKAPKQKRSSSQKVTVGGGVEKKGRKKELSLSKLNMAPAPSRERRGLPEPLLYYLKKNPNPRLLLKLIQSSKYFCFKEFPCQAVEDLKYENKKWKYFSFGKRQDAYQTLDFENFAKFLWISNKLDVYYTIDSNALSRLLTKTAVCHLKKLDIRDQSLKMNEFQFLISSKIVEDANIYLTEIFHDDGSVVAIEEIVKLLPNLKYFSCIYISRPYLKTADMALNNSMMSVPSGEAIPLNQSSFRKTLLFYLKTNAKPRLLLKLMQISKYFCFKEFPYMVVKDLTFMPFEWRYHELGSDDQEYYQILDLDNLTKPLWIIGSFSPGYHLSHLLSKTAVCDIKGLSSGHYKMDEFKFLNSSNTVEEVHFFGTPVFYDNGSTVPIDEIVKLLPNLRIFTWDFGDSASEITPASTTKLIEYLNPSILTFFQLINIPETFDFTLFAKFMDQNPSIRFNLCFRVTSDEHTKIINDYVKKLNESVEYRNRKITIGISEVNEEPLSISSLEHP